MYQLLWQIFHQPHPDFRSGRNAEPQNLGTTDKKISQAQVQKECGRTFMVVI